MKKFEKVDGLLKELDEIEEKINEAFKKTQPSANHIKNLANKTILEVETLELIEQHEKYSAMLFDEFIKNGVPEGMETLTRNQFRYEKSLYTKEFLKRVGDLILEAL